MKNLNFFWVVIFLNYASNAQPVSETTSIMPPDAVVQESKRKWKVLVDMWSEANVNGPNREKWSNIILLRPFYSISESLTFALGQELYHSWGALEGKERGEFKALDTYLELFHHDIAEFGPMSVSGYIRPYFPTSEASQDSLRGRDGLLRAALNFTVPLSSIFRAGYSIEPRYFSFKNKVYAQGEGWHVNEHYRVKHWLFVRGESQTFIGYQYVGVTSRYFHQDTDNKTNRTITSPQQDNLYWESGIGFKIDNFSFLGGLYSETSNDFRKYEKNFVLFNDTEYLYFLEGAFVF